MEEVLVLIIGAICKMFALPLAEDAIKGELTVTTEIKHADPTPTLDAAIDDAIGQDIDAGLVAMPRG